MHSLAIVSRANATYPRSLRARGDDRETLYAELDATLPFPELLVHLHGPGGREREWVDWKENLMVHSLCLSKDIWMAQKMGCW